LAAADEAEGLAIKGKAVYFLVNGYKIEVTCKIV
jgi:hypothetical protein